MRLRLFTLLLLFAASTAMAHPSVSVVIDSRGNVFYSDLKQVWRIAPNGARSIAVPKVHSHEVVLDANDNLYGEHLWYEGDRTKKWGHYVWMRSPDGRVTTIIPPTEGFLNNYSFVRDRAGNHYWAARESNSIMKRTPDGKTEVCARGKFHDIRWMTSTADGTIFLIDATDLMRISPNGSVATVARNLSHPRLRRPDIGTHHLVMGLWTDGRGDVYVSDYAGGEVKRVTPSGRVMVVARSPWPWGPTGGAFAPNGNLWILEWSMKNDVRVRRIALPRK